MKKKIFILVLLIMLFSVCGYAQQSPMSGNVSHDQSASTDWKFGAVNVGRAELPVVTQSPSATGTVTINCANTGLAIIAPTATSQADTIAFSNLPTAGQVQYLRIEIVAPASGTITIVWPTSNFKWLGGVSGKLTALTANMHYEYAMEIQNGVINASIISEGAY